VITAQTTLDQVRAAKDCYEQWIRAEFDLSQPPLEQFLAEYTPPTKSDGQIEAEAQLYKRYEEVAAAEANLEQLLVLRGDADTKLRVAIFNLKMCCDLVKADRGVKKAKTELKCAQDDHDLTMTLPANNENCANVTFRLKNAEEQLMVTDIINHEAVVKLAKVRLANANFAEYQVGRELHAAFLKLTPNHVSWKAYQLEKVKEAVTKVDKDHAVDHDAVVCVATEGDQVEIMADTVEQLYHDDTVARFY